METALVQCNYAIVYICSVLVIIDYKAGDLIEAMGSIDSLSSSSDGHYPGPDWLLGSPESPCTDPDVLCRNPNMPLSACLLVLIYYVAGPMGSEWSLKLVQKPYPGLYGSCSSPIPERLCTDLNARALMLYAGIQICPYCLLDQIDYVPDLTGSALILVQ